MVKTARFPTRAPTDSLDDDHHVMQTVVELVNEKFQCESCKKEMQLQCPNEDCRQGRKNIRLTWDTTSGGSGGDELLEYRLLVWCECSANIF